MLVNDYLFLITWHKHKTRKTFLRCKMPRWNFLNISHNKNIHLRGQTCCNVNFVQGKNTKNVLISQYAECKIVFEIVYKILSLIFFQILLTTSLPRKFIPFRQFNACVEIWISKSCADTTRTYFVAIFKQIFNISHNS